MLRPDSVRAVLQWNGPLLADLLLTRASHMQVRLLNCMRAVWS
jgi:hypothetical protein